MKGIRELRAELKMSQATLARLADTSQPQIRRLESGERKLTKEWAERLSGPLRVTAEELMFGSTEELGMAVLGVIEAGHFRDITVDDQSEDRPRIAIARDERFPNARQYALLVSGDSMNEMFPDGSHVTCVDIHDSGLSLKNGMIVHVERSMGGGQFVETTLKEIERNNGEIILKPRSTNPRYKPMRPVEQDGVTIEVRGIVTGRWEPFRF